jgi:outer membrane protein OmpA-like peptidoglycan-associated protein
MMKILAALCASAVLAGCGAFLRTPVIEGCEPVVRNDRNSLTFKGIVLPIGATTRVQVANISYEPAELQVITDSIQALANNRLTQCVYVSAALKTTPPATVQQLILIRKEFTDMDTEANRLFFLIKDSTSAQAVIAQASSILIQSKSKTENVEKILTTPAPISDLKPTLKEPISLSELPAELFTRLDKFETSLSLLRTDFAKSPAAKNGSKTITVVGFENSSARLSDPMKASLIRDFELALPLSPAAEAQLLNVIGYADTSGSYLRNVDLGIRRASEVASFLTKTFPDRAKIGILSSGGAQGPGADQRKVMVHITVA